MTENSRLAYAGKETAVGSREKHESRFPVRNLLLVALLAVLYWRSAVEMHRAWTMVDSYYSHGFLVPLISLAIAWTKRDALRRAPRDVSGWGYAWVAFGLFLLIVGDFLGFRVISQLSMLPVLTGLIILLFGKSTARVLWFPIAFLLFMIPIPPSLTQSVALHLKLVAAELAVRLARFTTLPMVREGSYIHFNGDKLLVGEVCGGLRSLIALLAVGALATYFSRTKPWARAFLLFMSVPIAIVANVARIYVLCVAGYFWGSKVAAGRVHDVSGILIFVVAFGLFFALEAYLRRVASREPSSDTPDPDAVVPGPTPRSPRTVRSFLVVTVLLVLAGGLHLAILNEQAKAAPPEEVAFDIPPQIGRFKQVSQDAEVETHVKRVLETSSILIRPYASPEGWPVQLTIVYAGKTRRSLHFPEVCLVGGGWNILKQDTVPVGFMFHAKRLVLVKGDQRQAVLYWFKTGDVLTGNYFLNAYYWAQNQLSFGTPTSAMIKLTAPIPPTPGGEEAAFSVLDEFALRFTPVLRERVP